MTLRESLDTRTYIEVSMKGGSEEIKTSLEGTNTSLALLLGLTFERVLAGSSKDFWPDLFDVFMTAVNYGIVKKGGSPMGFKICPYCGAHLDPGEECDCRSEDREKEDETEEEESNE